MLHTRITSARPVCGDVALWGALAAATGFGFWDAGSASLVLDLFLPLAVLAVAVPWSRRRPGAAVVLVNGLCVWGLSDSATPGNAHVLSLVAVSCLLGARVAAAWRPLLVLVGCAAVDLATCAVLRTPPVWWFYAMTVLPAALLLPWLAGRHWRGRRELVREGWRLARSLEERQHLVAERARLTERADIAADMHDSLGHALSLVALRAGALELSPDLTDRDRADLVELRRTIADAVEQLRETVAVLHDPPGTDKDAVLPVNGTVEDLLSRAAASGVPVQWERRGAVPEMSPLVERGMHRVVQEALTNAVKHAPDCSIRVRITHEPDRTGVSVVNAAPPGGGPSQPGESLASGVGGRGLTGLRERVTVLGGSMRAGPGEGGFHVTAVFPHQATAIARRGDAGAGTGIGRWNAGRDPWARVHVRIRSPPGPGPGNRHSTGHRCTGVRQAARLRTERRPSPLRRRPRGTCRRSCLLRTIRLLPGLATHHERAAALPVRGVDHRPAARRTRPSPAGPRLSLPVRPGPFRIPTTRHTLRVLSFRPRPVG
ncbi:sensor histidine kinase [Streptomyces sp. S063]|uniref:sensor histidine kinase n=1 Tax=Streptomyces sp. S063 TaxID=2005885 RepID=UPI001F0219B1|nr:histidine kinase [Streptomyces sp. S063]